VVKVVEAKGGSEPVPPESCPRCETPVALEGKYLRCQNPECPGKVDGDIKRWVHELEIDSLGEKWIATLIGAGLIADPADLYRLTPEVLVPLERMADILAAKVVRNIAETRDPPLDRFIAALNIPEFSRQRAQMLIDAGHDTREKLRALTVEGIAGVKGFKETLAGKIAGGLAARRERIEKLRAAGVAPRPGVPKAAAPTGPLAGKTFCFTGAVKAIHPATGKAWTRKELQALVEAKGGRNLSDVSSGLDYLVLADPGSTSSKAQKARKLGTALLSEEEFFRLLEK
jgi:DNA ligase (NAD+)